MINPREFGGGGPKLTPEMIKGDVTVLSIKEVAVVPVDRDGHEAKALVIHFAEFPDHAYWPNGKGVSILVEQLGDDEEAWTGKKIPLEKAKTMNPSTKSRVEVLWICPAKEWSAYLAKAKARRR